MNKTQVPERGYRLTIQIRVFHVADSMADSMADSQTDSLADSQTDSLADHVAKFLLRILQYLLSDVTYYYLVQVYLPV